MVKVTLFVDKKLHTVIAGLDIHKTHDIGQKYGHSHDVIFGNSIHVIYISVLTTLENMEISGKSQGIC